MKIKTMNMKIFKQFSMTTLPKTGILDNVTKTRNKIIEKISDFTVYQFDQSKSRCPVTMITKMPRFLLPASPE
jgi:hypothetical protein